MFLPILLNFKKEQAQSGCSMNLLHASSENTTISNYGIQGLF